MARKRKRRGHGEGSIRCIIKGKKYRVEASGGVDHNGRRKRTSRVVHGSEAAATKTLRKLQQEFDDGRYVSPEKMTFQSWAE